MFDNRTLLKINNRKLTGWKNVEIKKSMFSLCGSFSFEIVYRDGIQNFVSTQDVVEIYLDSDKIMTGYIDTLNPTLDDMSKVVRISGREKTEDLVDCSAVNNPGTWKNTTLFNIVNAICNPFADPERTGIKVISTVGTLDRFTKFSINTGESMFEAISRACSERAVLPITDSEGNIVLTTLSDIIVDDKIIEGFNVKNASQTTSTKERYSEYIVKSQYSTPGTGWNKSKISVFATAQDESIQRFRPLMIRADDSMTQKVAQSRVNWEAQIRAGRQLATTVSLVEWRQADGSLWAINTRVPVDIPTLLINSTLLITDVVYKFNTDGRTVSLTLNDPYIFKEQPKNKVKKTSDNGWTL